MPLASSIIQEDCQNILKLAPCDWTKLRGKRIFLTGGTGFFGKWFLHSFLHVNQELQLNASIVVLSRSPEKFLAQYPFFDNHKELSFIHGDVRDFVFPNGNFDILIHAATPASAKLEAENPNEMYSIIVDGTKHALNFAKATGIKRILLTSSGAVYGPQPPELERIPETYPPHPVTAYGRGKYESEKLCLASGIDTVIARCFAFVGPYLPLDIHYAIGNFIRDAINGNTIIVKGDGRPYRSYMYAADLMIWLWTVLLEAKSCEIYNIGSETSISIAELARFISNTIEPNINYKILANDSLSNLATRYIPLTQKSKNYLSLKQNYMLKDSLLNTISFIKSHI